MVELGEFLVGLGRKGAGGSDISRAVGANRAGRHCVGGGDVASDRVDAIGGQLLIAVQAGRR